MDWFAEAAADLLLGGRCTGCGRPGRVLCPGCRASLPARARLAWPTPTPPGLAPPWAAGEYADVLRALVVAHKEHAVHGLRGPLAGLLALAVAAAVPSRRWPVALVPVPSRPGVARRRGHEPTGALVAAAARELRRGGYDAAAVPLLRSRGGVVDQAGLDSAARAANLAGSLACPARRLDRLAAGGRAVRVVVCDDVLTTGATAREGQRALEAVGLRVDGIATVAATRRTSLPKRPPAG